MESNTKTLAECLAQITVKSTRVAGDWNAYAYYQGEVVGWCCTKNRKFAEAEARRGGESHVAQRRQLRSGTAMLVDGLKPFLQKSAA